MLVTYNSILIITAVLPNLNATAPKNPGRKLEQRCSICADMVYQSQIHSKKYKKYQGQKFLIAS